MDTQEKMFYTPSEACKHLGIDGSALTHWVNRLHIETRSLPHTKGIFITKQDIEVIQENMKHPEALF